MQFWPSTHKWIDLFIILDVLVGIKAYIGEEAFMTFDVQDDGRLIFTHKETNMFSFCLCKELRITNDGFTLGLRSGSTKDESFLEVLDSGNEINISIILGS